MDLAYINNNDNLLVNSLFRCLKNTASMLVQRIKHWASIEPAVLEVLEATEEC